MNSLWKTTDWAPTDWNLEADMLKMYLDYCIDWRFERLKLASIRLDFHCLPQRSAQELMQMFAEHGWMIVDEINEPEDIMESFEEWRESHKIYSDGKMLTMKEAVKQVSDMF